MDALPSSRTTNAAEGLARRRFTVAEIEQMVAVGIITPDERIELIGGDVVPMSPKGDDHEILKAALSMSWTRRLPPDLMVVVATTFRLTPDTYLEPISSSIPRRAASAAFPRRRPGWWSRSPIPASVTISAARRDFMLRSASPNWVIDAVRLTTHVHREPEGSRYRTVTEHGPHERLVPLVADALAVTLGDLDLR